jgi:hypothetical protein
MNRKNHDVEKQRYWQRTIGDAARRGDVDSRVLPAAPLKGKPILLVATQTEGQPPGAEQVGCSGQSTELRTRQRRRRQHSGGFGAGAAGRPSATHQPGSPGRDSASCSCSHGAVRKKKDAEFSGGDSCSMIPEEAGLMEATTTTVAYPFEPISSLNILAMAFTLP